MDLLEEMLRLVLREQWRGGPGALRDPVPLRTDPPPDQATFVAAAAALGAGEPRRALQRLGEPPPDGDGDRAAVDRALRRLALALEHNWFPGGAAAVLDPGEVGPFALPTLPATSAPVQTFVEVLEFLTSLPTLRTIAAGLRRGSTLPGAERALTDAASFRDRLLAAPAPVPASAVALASADLYVRAGRAGEAGRPLQLAVGSAESHGDAVGVAACVLALGDWSAEPLSHPELLGEDLEGDASAARGVAPDAATAGDRYADAERRFAAAGAVRGVAAVALRRAGLALRAGDPAGAADALDRCHALAVEAGDGALARLAVVHRALVAVEAGEEVAVDAVADDLATWAGSVGSRSFVRGLARLCHAHARRLRDDIGRARRALLLAEGINDRIGAVTEPALVSRELVEQYASVNYRRAALVLVLLDLDEAAQTAAPSPVEWSRLVDLAVRASADATALADPEGLERVRGHLQRLLAAAPGGEPETAELRRALEATLATAPAMAELYRGTRARREGDLEEADHRFRRALALTRSLGPAGLLSQAVVLGTMRRVPEALAIVRGMVWMRVLPPDQAATFLARLGRYDLAGKQLHRLDRLTSGSAVGSERPWERPALRAEILVGVGRAREALPVAEEAVAHFEAHLAGLSRDVLRTMASDSPVAAGLYTTAVRAHGDLWAVDGLDEHLEAAFALSDRSRGSSLTDLVDLDRSAGGDPATVAAVRAWLRAGAALARTVEDVAGERVRGPGAEIRRRIRAAERDLDDCEASLAATAPALLAGRRRLTAPRSLAETRSRLGAGALLVQYHAYDDQVIAWAITRDGGRMVRTTRPTPVLWAQVRRYHRAVADPRSTDAERAAAAEPLTELLVQPLAEEFEAHGRVVVVPHGPLAVLPFHTLPWRGADLATTHVVSYLPSAGATGSGDRRRVGGDAETLVVGDPEYGTDSRLRPLPGAGAEATAVARLRGTTPLVGPTATREAVLGGLATADVVHLATHGSLVEGSPYSAELALAHGAHLTVPDLMGLDTSVSLAVLSACDSGRGGVTAAGDVIGLTRALLAAGADELVVSLWPVDDRAACVTMVRLHEELVAGLPPAQALSAATQAVRGLDRAGVDQRYRDLLTGGAEPPGAVRSARKIDVPQAVAGSADLSHPYFWAPFVHIGL